MIELIQRLAETPLPQIFIIAGIFFLILSVVNKFGGKLDINPKRQGQAIVIGILLIIVGLGIIYIQPFQPVPPHPIEPEEEFILSVYSIQQNDVISIDHELCKIHISKGIPSNNVIDQEKGNTEFSVRVNNQDLIPISDIRPMQDENGGWHLEQFFEFRLISPEQQYKVEGKTLELNGNIVDSRVFLIKRE